MKLIILCVPVAAETPSSDFDSPKDESEKSDTSGPFNE